MFLCVAYVFLRYYRFDRNIETKTDKNAIRQRRDRRSHKRFGYKQYTFVGNTVWQSGNKLLATAHDCHRGLVSVVDDIVRISITGVFVQTSTLTRFECRKTTWCLTKMANSTPARIVNSVKKNIATPGEPRS
ncbi:unnamed protein product [Macrosiphum euphorbiae]|uniref:Uncharacterized protein n=1 Tax=Macrosiphum euphorbiae TaxID=13131 RepID=A0AAV0XZH7_9HEMI|nr:unnamed protein product [Macrosiphum euphorbiae]